MSLFIVQIYTYILLASMSVYSYLSTCKCGEEIKIVFPTDVQAAGLRAYAIAW